MWAYVPSGNPDVYLFAFYIVAGAPMTVKDAWVKMSITFVASGTYVGIGIANQTTATLGQIVYIDDVQSSSGPVGAGFVTNSTITQGVTVAIAGAGAVGDFVTELGTAGIAGVSSATATASGLILPGTSSITAAGSVVAHVVQLA